jgi:Icc-related predicted phosphoesterase
MRIAATADIHFTPPSYDRIRDMMTRVRDEADVLVIAGDLTNHGNIEEAHSLLNALVQLRIPTVAVLGNHDYESGQQDEIKRLLTTEGIIVLDGENYERGGVGFAGVKGFIGGFGRGLFTPSGEPELKAFEQAGVNEALKLERAMTFMQAPKKVVITHYAPVADTLKGEPPEIYPFLGSSRLADIIDRQGATLAVHGHAHRGAAEGRTIGGVPVHNVSLPLLLRSDPPRAYRLLEV